MIEFIGKQNGLKGKTIVINIFRKMVIYKSNSTQYLKSLKRRGDANAIDIDEVIKLYEERKIPRLDTAELLIHQLQSRGRATQGKAKTRLNKSRYCGIDQRKIEEGRATLQG